MEALNNQNMSLRRKRNSNLAQKAMTAFLILAGLGGSGAVAYEMYQGARRNNQLVNSHIGTKTITAESGDTPWEYAVKLKEEHPKLKGIDTRSLIDKILGDNNGKYPQAGQPYRLRVYETQE